MNRFGRTARAFFAGALAASLASMGAVGAEAATATPSPSGLGGAYSVTKKQTNQECLNQVRKARSAGRAEAGESVCTVTITLDVSAEQVVSSATDLAAATASLSAADALEVSAAAASGTVYSRTYQQDVNNSTDKERQSGRMYYDGTTVWVTDTYRGYKGSHTCSVVWTVGYDVTNKKCDEYGSAARKYLEMQWHFKPLYVIAGWDETYTMVVKADGSYVLY